MPIQKCVNCGHEMISDTIPVEVPVAFKGLPGLTENAQAGACGLCKRIHLNGVGYDIFGMKAFLSEEGMIFS